MNKILILLLLTACGELPKEETAPVAPAVQAEAKPAPEAQSEEELANNSYYLKTKAEMWPCTDKYYRQLVYVAEETTFYHCDKNEWMSVDLRGDKGEKGDKGDKGEAGADAPTPKVDTTSVAQEGKNGKDGRDGRDGKDAPYVGPDEWIDPATGYKWYLGMSIDRMNIRDFDDICNAPGEAATTAELKAARKNGLYDQLRKNLSENSVWLWVGLDHNTYGFTVGVATNVCKNASCGFEGQINPVNYFTDPQATKTFHRTLCVIK